MPARGVERWLTQRLSHRLGRRSARRRRGVRRRPVPPAALAGLAAARPRPRRPVGPRAPRLAAARHHRRQPRRALVRRRSPPTSATAAPATTPSCGATAATAWRSGWRRCSRRTPSSGRSWSPTGARGATPTAPAGRSTPTWPGSPSCGAGCSAAVDADAARRPPRRDARRPARRAAAGLGPAAAAVAVRPHPAAGHRGRAAGRARRATATSTSASRRPRPRCGTPSPTLGGVVARDDDDLGRARRPPAARLARPRRPRAAAHARRGRLPERRRGRAGPATPSRPRCSACCSTTCAPTTRPTVDERPAAATTRPTAASRCTPATARPARSTCCARCWSACSQDDPTLEPRDILVMCPDIETYAPLISAGFGLVAGRADRRRGDGHPAHRLRVKLADRALVSTNPLLAVAGSLLELSGGRVTASEVLDLAATEPCRRRFGFTDDDLERAGRWVAQRRRPVGARPATRGRRSRWTGSRRTPGAPASTGSCSAWR